MNMMNNMEAMMNAFQHPRGRPQQNQQRRSVPGPCFQLGPIEIRKYPMIFI